MAKEKKSRMERERRHTVRAVVALVFVLVFLCVGTIGIGWKLMDVVSPEELFFVLGGLAAVAVILVAFIMFGGIVIVMSYLRNREDAEDDKRELDLMRTIAAFTKGQTRVVLPRQQQYGNMIPPIVNVAPGGYPQQQAPPIIINGEDTDIQ